ncbi:hypothetical protein LJC14_04245 [Treponema sp. OttesenSCG-928-L16]|nr:hypothetical protein [Treponema sp. OttesenSCG-928-L16]
MKNRKRFIFAVLGMLLGLALFLGCNKSPGASSSANPAAASVTWPSGSIRFIVPSKAGGVTDIYTRYGQKSLQASTSANYATVNYDNESVAYEQLRSARPDGATLLFQHSTMICKYLTGAVDYNPSVEFKVVGVTANMGSQAIIAGPNTPYNTWEEFVAYAKKNPGQINTAVSTNGTTHFIFGQVQKNCGVELNLVECAAEADKLTNVAGGIIDIANCSLGNAREYERAGKLKVLGVLGSGKPEPEYPEWKPITDVIWESYLYCFAPTAISADTAQAINQTLKSLTSDAAYAEECRKIGGEALWLDLASSQQHFADTMAELGEVATALGINARN